MLPEEVIVPPSRPDAFADMLVIVPVGSATHWLVVPVVVVVTFWAALPPAQLAVPGDAFPVAVLLTLSILEFVVLLLDTRALMVVFSAAPKNPGAPVMEAQANAPKKVFAVTLPETVTLFPDIVMGLSPMLVEVMNFGTVPAVPLPTRLFTVPVEDTKTR